MRKKLWALLSFLTIAGFTSRANISLPSILGSHMVLQQNSEATLWGWCAPGERIRVMVGWDTTVYSTVGNSGARFSLKIKTPAAGGPYTIVLNGQNAVVLEDVQIGEVWVCSGQSNMEWSGDQGLPQTLEEAPNATNQNIRFFYVQKSTSNTVQDDCRGRWVVCNPEDMKHFSAIGYFFGKKLQQELKVPIGLINSNWGGTPAEVWTPKETVEGNSTLKQAAAKLNPAPWWPVETGLTYNAMIAPITQFPIAGALWYQGESNTGTAASYTTLLTAMIDSWRKAWNKEFPFYFVQIAPFAYGSNNIGALLREAQSKAAAHSNTGMVVISDLVSDVKNIHPTDKVNVALRLANYALAQTYGKQGLAYKSPSYEKMTVDKDRIRISFSNAEKGLISKNGAPTEFYIAGADKKFVPATAVINGNTVTVSSREVKNPVAVRFGFSNTAMPNLFSKDGLPVDLFRTDDWEVDTTPVKQ